MTRSHGVHQHIRIVRFVSAIVVVAIVWGANVSTQTRVDNASAGISIAPPSGWAVTSVADVMKNRGRVRLPDRELQAGMQRATAPLFVFSRYPEPHPSINPTIQVVLRPQPASLGTSATEMLRAATDTLRRAFPDFRIVEPIRRTQVSGFDAAYMKAAYTLMTTDGRNVPVLARTWLVPRGSFMFLIGMSGAAEGPDVCEDDFTAALASVRIEP